MIFTYKSAQANGPPTFFPGDFVYYSQLFQITERLVDRQRRQAGYLRQKGRRDYRALRHEELLRELETEQTALAMNGIRLQ
jgi:hypothetical protein